MVNKTPSIRQELLTLLKSSDTPLTGPALGQRLRISRVAVWKQIQGLRDLGYTILSDSRGYILQQIPDAPYPWELNGTGAPVHYKEKSRSTMLDAREGALKGTPAGTLFLAGSQSEGRGRENRPWDSAPGGLYGTLVLRPEGIVQNAMHYPLAAAATLCELIQERYGLPARAKWPNDVLIRGRKCAGFLTEIWGEIPRIGFLNLGFGINLNNQIETDDQEAVPLKSLLNTPLSRRDFLSAYLTRLYKRVTEESGSTILRHWSAYSSTLNRRVSITPDNRDEPIRGLATGISPAGGLELILENRETKTFYSGRCRYLETT